MKYKRKSNVEVIEMFMTQGSPMNQAFVIEAINHDLYHSNYY